MLTRTQLILMTAMSTLGGSFAGLLVAGMIAGDVTLAIINLGVIVALFSSVFVIGSGSGESPAKKLLDTDSFPSVTYYSVDFPHEFSFQVQQDLTGSNGIRAHKLARARCFGEKLDDNILMRSGDLHVGGEVLPEFKN